MASSPASAFTRAPKNTGTHVGNLWAADGTLLATATFSGESASGWQTVSFSQPVAIKAGTTYIASYHTNVGNYSDDIGFFSKGAVTNGPLTALANGADGPNGVYQYGASSGFPANTYNGSNYWVDVVLTSLVNSVTPSNKATGVATNATVQIRFNTAMDTSTLNTSTLLLRNAANNTDRRVNRLRLEQSNRDAHALRSVGQRRDIRGHRQRERRGNP